MNFGLTQEKLADICPKGYELFFNDLNDTTSELVIHQRNNKLCSLMLKKMQEELRIILLNTKISEKERLYSSRIAQHVKAIVEEKSSERLAVITGLLHVTMDEYLVQDFDAYYERCEGNYLTELESKIQELKTDIKETKRGVSQFSSVFSQRTWHLIGEDGYLLAQKLESERLITISKKESIRTYIRVMPGDSFVKDTLAQSLIIEAIRKWGYGTSIQ